MKLTFYSDAGHGWLGVPLAMLKRLGIAEKISGCSYLEGNIAYLEEDCDASLFLSAAAAKGIELEISDYYCGSFAFVRNLPSFSV